MIPVTKAFFPPFEEYVEAIRSIWQSGFLTNQGEFAQKLEAELIAYLGINHLHFVSNGTIALQLALHALDIKGGEVITTPFTFVVTMNSILWERCKPVFVDVEKDTFCIDAAKIEQAITPETKAILGVHVYGLPCDVEKIDSIAKKYNLKVIYDAAHAFGVKYKGKSLLYYGDISTCSFHATKLFHTAEGGCLITKEKEIAEKIEQARNFGLLDGECFSLGINAKNSELHAAMGLCNLKYVAGIIQARKDVCNLYTQYLAGYVQMPKINKDIDYNYAYYPILLKDEKQMISVVEALNKKGIFPRRYFSPSLNEVPYLKESNACSISENIASRVICLPLYVELSEEKVKNICEIILMEIS